jgi:predicted TIM-barrel fold metal-dependent hydrolase
MTMATKLLAFVLALLLVPPDTRAQQPLPIIDMHLHAYSADANGPPPLGLCIPLSTHLPPLDPGRQVFKAVSREPRCADPIWSPLTDAAVMDQTTRVMKRRNIIGVLSGAPERVLRWREAAPDRFIPSVEFQLDRDALSPESLRRLFEDGPFAVLGEVANQYLGIAPDDQRMVPYWLLAEKLDIPVAIHMGEGPPGAGYLIPTYRARLTSPYLLEEVLLRHPRLRVSVMHYGSPLIDEMISMLGTYPQLYVDIGGVQWAYPREYFYKQLRTLIDAGFGKRVMFGSDQMVWPGVIEPAIAIVEEAPFLSEEQKRDIFYNNAARFLRLSKEEIARHHSGITTR